LGFDLRILKSSIDRRISGGVMKRQEELKGEFDYNCSIAFRVLAEEAEVQINCLTEWNSEVKAAWLGRFCDLVHYDELNENMRRFFRERYHTWVRIMTGKLEYEVSTGHTNGQTALVFLVTILVFTVVAIAYHCSNKRCRSESGTDEI
jgi:hypothetical protein